MYTLAIIGRPNVGKSTFFNRIARKKLAIVEDRPGVTRDWRDAEVEIDGKLWRILDTAGLEDVNDNSVEARMRFQSEQAIEMADAILMVIDARAGVTPTDQYFANLVRKTDKPVFLAANKCEGSAADAGLYDAYSLGLGNPIALSAEHGHGMGDFIDHMNKLYDQFEEENPTNNEHHKDDDDEEDVNPESIQIEEGEEIELPEDEVKSLKLAIVGRPNVGKSTLVNALLGEHRMMTGDEAGITRDSIATEWEYKDVPIRLVDTAGVRRKARINDTLEKTMAQESFRAIRLAHVVAVVIDGALGIDKQDLAIARRVIDEGRSLVLLVNKWDIIEDHKKTLEEIGWRLEDSLAQVKDIPIIPISALKGKRLNHFMDGVLHVYDIWNRRVPTGEMNRWLDQMAQSHPAPLVAGRQNKIKYITQIKTRPPTFALWVSRPNELPDSYKRYIINGLRERFGLPSVPIRMILKTSKNPYA